MKTSRIKIGTRKSELALWQARRLQTLLLSAGVESEITGIQSFGDDMQDIPLHKLGDKGIFTKALDEAILSGSIDIAIHSLKDVPTVLEDDLVLASVPERANPADVLVRPETAGEYKKNEPLVIATSSIRRAAFWKNKFPESMMVDLRGNVPTRLKKVDSEGWSGAIFAYAGLQRLGYEQKISEVLEWMIPAPGQGALGVISLKNSPLIPLLESFQDSNTRLCVDFERAFLNRLDAGCSSPVGALARISGGILYFDGAVLTPSGSEKISLYKKCSLKETHPESGIVYAEEILNMGAEKLLQAKN